MIDVFKPENMVSSILLSTIMENQLFSVSLSTIMENQLYY